MGDLLNLVNEEVHGEDFSNNISMLESIEDDLNVGDTSQFPKVTFINAHPNTRSGDVVRGERVMGHIRFGNREATLLVPSRYDYKEVGSLKDGVVLALLENNLTQVVGSTYTNATLVKLNLKTKTITFPSQRVLDGEYDGYEWDKATRVKMIAIHLPFKKTVD